MASMHIDAESVYRQKHLILKDGSFILLSIGRRFTPYLPPKYARCAFRQQNNVDVDIILMYKINLHLSKYLKAIA